jgi:hypothetical protein
VLGTPLSTDFYVRNFVAKTYIKITRDVEKLEPLTDGFINFQLIQKTMNTRTHHMSANITLSSQEQFLSAQHCYKHVHVDMTITNAILKKGTRGSFHLRGKDDHDLVVTIIQKPHALGGFGLTPNVIAKTSAKVAMASRFLGWSDLYPEMNNNFGTASKYSCKVQEMYTVQDHPPPPSEFLLLLPLGSLYKDHV